MGPRSASQEQHASFGYLKIEKSDPLDNLLFQAFSVLSLTVMKFTEKTAEHRLLPWSLPPSTDRK